MVRHRLSGCTDLPLNSVERSGIRDPNSRVVTHQLSVRERPRSRVPMHVAWTTHSGVTQSIKATRRVWPARAAIRGELHVWHVNS